MIQDEYQIVGDGITVWVNHISGYCIARFGRMGIDIHTSPEVQESGKSECLYCTHAPTTVEDWLVFVHEMEERFAIIVTDRYCPRRFK